jgi:hypothetical protein
MVITPKESLYIYIYIFELCFVGDGDFGFEICETNEIKALSLYTRTRKFNHRIYNDPHTLQPT